MDQSPGRRKLNRRGRDLITDLTVDPNIGTGVGLIGYAGCRRECIKRTLPEPRPVF